MEEVLLRVIQEKIVKKYPFRISSANPARFLSPEIFPELKELVKFSDGCKNYFKNLKKQK